MVREALMLVALVTLSLPTTGLINSEPASLFSVRRKPVTKRHARTMGTERCSVGTNRAGLAAETTSRWSRSSLAGHTSCAKRRAVDLGYGCAVA